MCLQGSGCAHHEITLGRHFLELRLQVNFTVFSHRELQDVTQVNELIHSLKRVVAVTASSSYMQEEIYLGRGQPSCSQRSPLIRCSMKTGVVYRYRPGIGSLLFDSGLAGIIVVAAYCQSFKRKRTE